MNKPNIKEDLISGVKLPKEILIRQFLETLQVSERVITNPTKETILDYNELI